MSDRSQTDPPNKKESGWQAPEKPGAWQKPEKKSAGWRVSALPKDLEEKPAETGAWHLPKAGDTRFTESDEIEIVSPEEQAAKAAAEPKPVPQAQPAPTPPPQQEESPEDALLKLVTASSEEMNAQRTADQTAAKPKPTAPEDFIAMLEKIDEDEGENDTFSMSELVALASLVEEEPKAAPTPTPAPTATATQTETPADAGEYARRQLAALEASDTSPGSPTGPQEPVDAAPAASATGVGAADPGEYARRQLAALGGDDMPPAAAPVPAPPRVDPRTEELARRFRDVEEEVGSLRRMYQNQQISADQLQEQLRQLMILDDDQIYWMLGMESDTWYKYDNNDWVPATPPPLIAVQQAQPATGSATLQFGTQDYINDSLPYLSDSQAQRADVYNSADIRLDENNMPLPRTVSESDMDRTVVGSSYLANELPGQSPTIANPGFSGSQATMPSPTIPSSRIQEPAFPGGGTVIAQPVDGYESGIESPYEATEPPAYEYDEEEEEAPVYERAAERRQRNLMVGAVVTIGVLVVLVAAAGIGGVLFASQWYNGIVEQYDTQIVALQNYQPEFQTVTITDYQGRTLATLARDGNERINVPLERISPYVIHALVSTENDSYFEDPGWDTGATIRAFLQNLGAGEITGGGSTLTQQVARRLVLQDDTVSTQRKLDEIVVAGELTQRYNKNFILEVYLNEFFFGNQTYGIEAASQFYFDKPAADVTMAEAAMLVGLLQAPAAYDPVTNRTAAIERMRVVIERMRTVDCLDFQHGQWEDNTQEFCISQQEETNSAGKIGLLQARVEARNFRAREFDVDYPHFVTLVRQRLETAFPGEMYRQAWTVRTTLVPELQDYAEDVLQAQIRNLADTGVTTGAVMATEPTTGKVLVYVGSPDFYDEENSGQVDYPRTYQQPGSTVKPILYAAAFNGVDRNANGALEADEYLTPASIVWDVPVTYTDIVPPYSPTNFQTNTFYGPVPVRQALQNSYNVSAVKVFDWMGRDGAAFANMANAMGINFADGATFGLATAVGATEVRLYDMMVAYGAIANDGVTQPLYVIESIQDDNDNFIELPESLRAPTQQAVSPQIAYLLQNILSDDAARGPEFGRNSALTIPGRPTADFVAAKTGTTNDRRDLWTMGFTNDFVVGVWMGRPDNGPIERVTGFTAAAPVWNQVMNTLIRSKPTTATNFQNPGGVVARQVCALTGAVVDASSNCPEVRNEWFADSRPPLPAGQGFVVNIPVNTWTGLRANEFCPDQANIQSRSFVNIADNSAISWLQTAQGRSFAARLGLPNNIQAPPTAACDINTVVPVARINSPIANETIRGVVAVLGQVGSAPTFRSYQLEVAPANAPNNFALLPGFPVTTVQPNTNSQLGQWDTTQTPNGQYLLRLSVLSTDGGFVTNTIPVIIDNPLPTPTPTPTITPFPTVDFSTAVPLPFDPTPGVFPTPTIDTSGS